MSSRQDGKVPGPGASVLMQSQFRYVFGPVRSGRLGVSLGLDLLGGAICSMDCLYCEVGPTRALTTTRKPYVPAATLLGELARWKDEHPDAALDYVTLGGMGEPCLNSELAAIIAGARKIYPSVPVAVLTNSTHLVDPAVRAELLAADAVLPSLDSLVPEEFERINRPAPGVNPCAVAEAILDFRREFSGKMFLEVLLLGGINDSDENLELLAGFVRQLAPDRVDVVTMTRPGAYPQARAADESTLARFRERLGANAAQAPFPRPGSAGAGLSPESVRHTILSSIRRRPQTAAQLAEILGLSAGNLASVLDGLAAEGAIRSDDDGFYLPAASAGAAARTARRDER